MAKIIAINMPKQLIISCVKWGKMYGSCYANRLYDMVCLHMPDSQPFRFICFTDNPIGLDPHIIVKPLPQGLTGWWNKLALFAEDIFTDDQQIIYFDLDTLITGSLTDLAAYSGDFALLQDFYRPGGYGSGVMLWRGGMHHHIWSSYEADGRPNIEGGDQRWIEQCIPHADLLQALFPSAIASYKTDCISGPPPGTRIICFHGEPKQDNAEASWVKQIWYGDHKPLSLPPPQAPLEYPSSIVPAHDKIAVIIGGSPSLHEVIPDLHQHHLAGHYLIAAGSSWKWLKEQNIPYNAYVIYHPTITKPLISSSGLKAMDIARALGYRTIHLYGMDSCYDATGAHHAYPLPEAEDYRVFDMMFDGKEFSAASWMITQAKDFVALAVQMLSDGCLLSIHGNGLIPVMAAHIAAKNNQ